jgi:hypothetical protein
MYGYGLKDKNQKGEVLFSSLQSWRGELNTNMTYLS